MSGLTQTIGLCGYIVVHFPKAGLVSTVLGTVVAPPKQGWQYTPVDNVTAGGSLEDFLVARTTPSWLKATKSRKDKAPNGALW